MNFKTTIALLLVLLAGLCVAIWTRGRGSESPPQKVHTLLDINAQEVSRLEITPASGPAVVLVRSSDPQAASLDRWRMKSPQDVAADPDAVNSLLNSFLKLKSTAEVRTSGSKAPRTGLDKPQYRVEITVNDKAVKIDVGDELAVGHGLYVRLEGKSNAEVVSADLLGTLDKSATSLRQLRLIRENGSQIQQIAINNQHGQFSLDADSKHVWTIRTGDKTMLGDVQITNSLPYTISGLTATDFVSDSAEAQRAQMGTPLLSVTISDQPYVARSASAPATQAKPTTITFLNYQDLRKKVVYVKVSDSPAIARLPASAMDAFDKGPVEFRDKTIVTINEKEVSRIEIRRDVPATTQPTSRPAEHSRLVLARRKPTPPATMKAATTTPVAATTPAATTPAATSQATTAAATQPATKPRLTAWVLESAQSAAADDVLVRQLLSMVGPLTATKFLDPAPPPPTDQTRYTLEVQTIAAGGQLAQYVIEIFDPGDEKPLVAHYHDLWFEFERSWATLLSSNFEARPGAPTEEELDAQPTQPTQPKFEFPGR